MNRPPFHSPPRPAGPRLPARTLADYLALALGPVLIMALVGSLNFFLLEVGYRGAFSGHMRWTLFWFTVASVLVSRISIEQGSRYGAVYGLALAAATGLRLLEFLGAPWSALLLLGAIWWCSARLTWDCTVIDDQADASGQGLLEPNEETRNATSTHAAAETKPAPAPADTRPHAPGRWLLRFSLGALPLFALGQWTIPVADAAARFRAFLLCALFVASALALLLTTSFLGLRRYLRQRQLTMPAPMARSWIGLGTIVLVVILAGAILLPRPRGLAPLAHLGLGLREQSPKASDLAWMRGQAAPGQGRRIGSDQDSPTSNHDQPRPDRASSDPDGSPKDSEPSDSGSAPKPGTPKPSPDGSAQANASPTEPRSPASAPPLPPLRRRWFSGMRGLALVAFLLLRYGRAWLALLRRSPSRPRPPAQPGPVPGPRRPAFADFSDPFADGRADRMTAEQLAAYSFDALQAWAADAGLARSPDRTPIEFANQMARRREDLAEVVQPVTRLYVRIAYGGLEAGPEAGEILRRLWAALRAG